MWRRWQRYYLEGKLIQKALLSSRNFQSFVLGCGDGAGEAFFFFFFLFCFILGHFIPFFNHLMFHCVTKDFFFFFFTAVDLLNFLSYIIVINLTN